MNYKIFPICLALLLGLAVFCPLSALASADSGSESKDEAPPPQEDPRQALLALQQAIDACDAEQTLRRVDFDHITIVFMESAMPVLNEQIRSGTLRLPQPLPALLGSLNSPSAKNRRPAQYFLAGEIRKLVLYGVASGYFAGKPKPQHELVALDGGLLLDFVNLKPGRKQFGPAILASQDKAGALLLTSLYDQTSGKSYDLELLMAWEGDHWAIFCVENGLELLELALEKK